MNSPTSPRRPHVVIVGGGFAGLYTAKNLRRSPVDITLIDKRNFHLFQPLLYQVATGSLSPADIASPLRGVLKGQKNIRVLMDKVIDIDPDKQKVVLEDHAPIAYDWLVVATGVSHHYFGNDHWAALAPGLKTIEDALTIRQRIFALRGEWGMEQNCFRLLRMKMDGQNNVGLDTINAHHQGVGPYPI